MAIDDLKVGKGRNEMKTPRKHRRNLLFVILSRQINNKARNLCRQRLFLGAAPVLFTANPLNKVTDNQEALCNSNHAMEKLLCK